MRSRRRSLFSQSTKPLVQPKPCRSHATFLDDDHEGNASTTRGVLFRPGGSEVNFVRRPAARHSAASSATVSSRIPTVTWVPDHLIHEARQYTGKREFAYRSVNLVVLMEASAASSTSPRDRLVEVASKLFYAEGITACGVDRVVAESGVSKPTLYAHFGSKEGLVAAVLQHRDAQRRKELSTYLRGRPQDARRRLLAAFDCLREWQAQEGYRGCAFVNAAAEIVDPESPVRAVIREHKRWHRALLAGLAREANLHAPNELAGELMLLVNGAAATALADQDPHAGRAARRAAGMLIAAHDAPDLRSRRRPPIRQR